MNNHRQLRIKLIDALVHRAHLVPQALNFRYLRSQFGFKCCQGLHNGSWSGARGMRWGVLRVPRRGLDLDNPVLDALQAVEQRIDLKIRIFAGFVRLLSQTEAGAKRKPATERDGQRLEHRFHHRNRVRERAKCSRISPL